MTTTLYLDRGRVDTAALPVLGRVTADDTLVAGILTIPLDDGVLDASPGRRMTCLDERAVGWSPMDTAERFAPGATVTPGKE
ncbi:hypothetical protein NE236_39145 [Actinoallomurus purpureus]|uniref:hypothetical protein n=1 Tax=Actinoallomurus purpureus TaxID=478114 RepID=UPI002092B6CE|nr:hypothetical protein [Actinoallomurus purpureus]MCO6010992.1 hypothetical protein [Actinoallomurus purpureus]